MNCLSQDLLDVFLQSLRDRARSPATVEGYSFDLQGLVARQVPLTTESLTRYIHTRVDGRPYAVRTRNRRLAAVRSLVRFLMARKLLSEDPTAEMGVKHPRRTIRLALGPEHLQQVITVLRERPESWWRVRDETILKLFYNTGLRLKELGGLNISQVDLAHGVLHGVSRKGWAGSTAPFAILNTEAKNSLKVWLAERPEVSSEALFLASRSYMRLSKRTIQSMLRGAGKRAGLPIPLTPHVLRHEFNEAMRRQGTPLDIRQLLMDHQSPETTRLYDHPSLPELRLYLDRLPRLEPS
jgi:site-specific recombinase XerD